VNARERDEPVGRPGNGERHVAALEEEIWGVTTDPQEEMHHRELALFDAQRVESLLWMSGAEDGVDPRDCPPERGLPRLPVDGPTIIRIDEREVEELGAAIDIRNAGHGEPDDLLRENRGFEVRSNRVQEAAKRTTEVRLWIGEPIEDAGEELRCRGLVRLVRGRPVGVALRLTERLLEVGVQTRSQFIGHPSLFVHDTEDRLVDEVLVVRIGCRASGDTASQILVLRPPAAHRSLPRVEMV